MIIYNCENEDDEELAIDQTILGEVFNNFFFELARIQSQATIDLLNYFE